MMYRQLLRSGLTAAAVSLALVPPALSDRPAPWEHFTDLVDEALPCVANPLILDGWGQLRITWTVNAAGDARLGVHYNAAQLTATDAAGNSYVGVKTVNISQQFPAAPGTAQTMHGLDIVRLASTTGPNVVMTLHVVVTMNAAGDITVNRQYTDLKCEVE